MHALRGPAERAVARIGLLSLFAIRGWNILRSISGVFRRFNFTAFPFHSFSSSKIGSFAMKSAPCLWGIVLFFANFLIFSNIQRPDLQ